jgi:hypothetical protein
MDKIAARFVTNKPSWARYVQFTSHLIFVNSCWEITEIFRYRIVTCMLLPSDQYLHDISECLLFNAISSTDWSLEYYYPCGNVIRLLVITVQGWSAFYKCSDEGCFFQFYTVILLAYVMILTTICIHVVCVCVVVVNVQMKYFYQYSDEFIILIMICLFLILSNILGYVEQNLLQLCELIDFRVRTDRSVI